MVYIPAVSAYFPDKVTDTSTAEKAVAKVYPYVEIDDWFGWGGKIASGQIIDHTPYCSDDCYSDVEITLEKRMALIEDIRFINIKDGKEIVFNKYELSYVSGTEEYQEDIYENVCIIINNKTTGLNENECEYKKTGTQTKTRNVYTKINIGDEFEPGKYTVRITGNKYPTQEIDWQIKIQGIWIEEWADWQSSLKNGLARAFKFDEGTGTKSYDNITNDNLTVTNAQWQATGKNIHSYDTNELENGAIGYTFPSGHSTITISMWLKKLGSVTANNGIFSTGTSCGGAGDLFMYISSSTQKLGWCIWANAQYTESATVGTFNVGEWNHIVMRINGTSMKIFENNVQIDEKNYTSFGATTNVVRLWSAFGTDKLKNWGVDEVYIYNRTLSLAEIGTLYASGTGSFYPFSSGVTLTSPADGSSQPNPVNFYCGATVEGANIANMSLWHNATGTFHLNKSVTGLTGTSVNVNFNQSLQVQNVKWTCQACADDDSCSFGENWTVNVNYAFNSSYPKFVYETEFINFTTNVTLSSTYVATNAKLFYNNTYFPSTITNGIALTQVNIPIVTSTTNISLKWMYDDYSINSTLENQTVYNITLSNCYLAYNTTYLNFSFKDEVSGSAIAAKMDSFTTDYWLGNGSIKKPYSFSNLSSNKNYAFCFLPSDRTVNFGSNSIIYSNTSYPTRNINLSATTYSNSSTNTILYLMNVNDGLYVTFQVLNYASQAISSVIVNATNINGLVGAGLTDASGAITFFLNPNLAHTITAFKAGYPILLESITPTQSSYTLTLGTSTSTNTTTYVQALDCSFQPAGTYLNNNTQYKFNVTMNSSYYTLSEFGIKFYVNGTLEDSDSVVGANTGVAEITYTTGNNSDINLVSRCYWIVDGTETYTDKVYKVSYLVDTEWSIKNFGDDIKTYLATGFFGLNSSNAGFTLGIISFLAILLITGIVSFKFGLYSPIQISILAVVVTAIFYYIGFISGYVLTMAVLLGLMIVLKEALGW